MHKRHSKKAFSLIELSIVILVLSILVAGSLGVSKTSISSSRLKTTKDRMDNVYKALGSFVATNKRLPCPALSTTAKGAANYGSEAGTGTGSCTGFTTATSTNLVYGMLPIQALGLDPDMAEDGFGTKFSYVVDQRFTKASVDTSSTDGFEVTKAVSDAAGAASIITVQNVSGGSTLMSNALFVIISHGANKFGGWNSVGTAQNPLSSPTVTEEDSNTGSPSGGSSFDATFYTSSTNPNFDDILLFKNKTQLAKDAGFEFMMCNSNEGTISATSSSTCSGTGTTQTWTNAVYSTSIPYLSSSNSGICSRMCGKYGVWGTASVRTTSASVLKSVDYTSGGLPLTGSGIFTYKGGTLIIICSATGYSTNGGSTPISVNVYIRDAANTTNVYGLATSPMMVLNTAIATNNHLSLPTRTFVVSPGNLTYGSQYRIRFEAVSGTFDSGDRFDATVIELP